MSHLISSGPLLYFYDGIQCEICTVACSVSKALGYPTVKRLLRICELLEVLWVFRHTNPKFKKLSK